MRRDADCVGTKFVRCANQGEGDVVLAQDCDLCLDPALRGVGWRKRAELLSALIDVPHASRLDSRQRRGMVSMHWIRKLEGVAT